jgi:predicted MFS family arabinose efflux permease
MFLMRLLSLYMRLQGVVCKISESKIIWLIFLVQYVTIFEFVIINPLSPDYIVELGIMTSDVGIIAGSFALTSAIIGLIAVTFIDNHDRKKVLVTCVSGLILSSIICLLSYDFKTFLISKIIAGMFAGTSTSISLAIMSDVIAPERRGRAMSKAMGAFPVVAAIGVPVALEISRFTGIWKAAFIMNLVIQVCVLIFVVKKLPEFKNHLHSIQPIKALTKYKDIFIKPKYLMAILVNVLSFFAGFLLIPNFATYFIFNLDFPREKLGLLFMIGGTISFFGMRIIGKLADKYSSYIVMSGLVFIMLFALYFRFISTQFQLPILAFFILFMFSMSSRNVVTSALSSKIPSAHDRASFFSIYNVAINIGTGLGGVASSLILVEGANLELINIEKVAILSIALTAFIPFLIWKIEKMIRA